MLRLSGFDLHSRWVPLTYLETISSFLIGSNPLANSL